MPLSCTLLKPAPADRQWCVNREEHEEGPAEENIQDILRGDVGGDIAAAPLLCNKVEKLLGRRKYILRTSPEGQCGFRG